MIFLNTALHIWDIVTYYLQCKYRNKLYAWRKQGREGHFSDKDVSAEL